jgi:hypothetical protein
MPKPSQNAAAKKQLFFCYTKKRKWRTKYEGYSIHVRPRHISAHTRHTSPSASSCIGVARKKTVVAVGGEGRVWRRAERQAGYVVPSTSASSVLPYITITISPNVPCELQQRIINTWGKKFYIGRVGRVIA